MSEPSSKAIQVTSTWLGFSELSYLTIFGDSYSSVIDVDHALTPTAIQPLGVPFPGYTYNEEYLPNWVGHLVAKYFPRSRFVPGRAEQDRAYLDHPLLVYDYAKGGDTILGVQRQIENQFLPHVSQRPARMLDKSLCITWVGINDCAYSRDHTSKLARLFVSQEKLYEAGARSFLFIDVPPIHRSPAFPASYTDTTTFDNFNSELDHAANIFATRHPDITVLLFSSSATFNRLLDAPEDHGFRLSDRRKAGGEIWCDVLHPTSRVHEYLAKDIAEFLQAVKRHEG